MQQYTADVLTEHSGISNSQAIFILGMPRSGTTLVEQILAAHPDVQGCGENSMLNQAMSNVSQSSITDPLAPCRWTTQQCEVAGSAYLQRVIEQQSPTCKFTDKTLSLIMHIGSIARFLPKAKIVYVRRNALDTCLSIYKNNISGGNFDYGHDLETLGHYYRAHEQLMDHWRQALPSRMLIEIDYEQLIASPEQQSKALVDACGLAWHPNCLDFQHSNNRVLTASMMQVRQPIYKRAIGSAQPYRKHLQPLIDALA